MNGARPDEEIEFLRRQLAELDQERARLEVRIAELKHRKAHYCPVKRGQRSELRLSSNDLGTTLPGVDLNAA
jgi:prefoldin subunit 5